MTRLRQPIQSATRWAAELMGQEDRVGSLQSGTHADLVVVPGDPTRDVDLHRRPLSVMKGGRWVVAPRA